MHWPRCHGFVPKLLPVGARLILTKIVYDKWDHIQRDASVVSYSRTRYYSLFSPVTLSISLLGF